MEARVPGTSCWCLLWRLLTHASTRSAETLDLRAPIPPLRTSLRTATRPRSLDRAQRYDRALPPTTRHWSAEANGGLDIRARSSHGHPPPPLGREKQYLRLCENPATAAGAVYSEDRADVEHDEVVAQAACPFLAAQRSVHWPAWMTERVWRSHG